MTQTTETFEALEDDAHEEANSWIRDMRSYGWELREYRATTPGPGVVKVHVTLQREP